MLGVELQRCLGWATAQRVAYTAQTGQDARKKLIDDQVPMLKDSPLWPAVTKVRMANDSTGVVFRNGSRIDVLASTDTAGHGKTLDLAVLDEVFADVDDRREQAMLPAMITRPSAQLLIVSTMGTDESLYLNRKVEIGRQFAESGRTDGIAYFEWSASPDDDPDDPDTWASCHPGLGHTIRLQELRHAHETMTPGEFLRAMLNVRSSTDERTIPAAAWDAVCDLNAEASRPACFAVEVHPDRTTATVVAGSADGTVEVVDHQPAVSWLAPRLRDLTSRFSAPVVLDAGGPAGMLAAELEQSGVRVITLTTRDVVSACSAFYDAVAERRIQIRRDVVLDLAAAAVGKRRVGDAWLWNRRAADTDVTPIMAASLAFHQSTRAEAEPAPFAIVL